MFMACIPAFSIMMKTSVFPDLDPNRVVLEYGNVVLPIDSGVLEVFVAGGILGGVVGALRNYLSIWTRALVLSFAVGVGYLVMWVSMGLNALRVFYNIESFGLWVVLSILVGSGLATTGVLEPKREMWKGGAIKRE